MGFADAYLLEAGRSILIVVDVQEKLLKVIHEADRVTANIVRLATAARSLEVPVLVTTQYAEKLGPTDPSVLDAAGEVEVIDKMSFSCLGSDTFRRKLQEYPGRTQAVLCGVETHVCVNQTAHDLLDEGFVVHLAADAISSRTEANYRFGLDRLRHVGATVSTTESVIFEWLRVAGTDKFREISKIVK